MSSGSFKICYLQAIRLHIIYFVYKQDLALNNLSVLMFRKTLSTDKKYNSLF